MGVTVRQKTKGRAEPWWVFINFRNKRKSIKVGDRKAAMALAAKIELQLKTGQVGLLEAKSAVPTFSDLAGEWHERVVLPTLSPASHRDYRAMLDRHILPSLGRYGVDQISGLMVKDLLRAKLAEGLSHSTVAHLRNVISGVMGRAVEAGHIQVNPAQRLGRGLIKAKDRKADVQPLSREELAAVLTVIRDRYPEYYPFALFLARTGARLGEALALEWGDLDFAGRFILIQRAQSHGGPVTTPKSGKGRRVDMSRQLSDTLRGLLTQRKKEALAKGHGGDIPARVFLTANWTAVDGDNFRNRIWKKALQAASISYRRVHDLRHSFASQLIQAGESLAYVRDQLGHHSISLTVDTYGHLVPGANRAAVDRLDDLDTQLTHQSAPYPHPGQNDKDLAEAKSL